MSHLSTTRGFRIINSILRRTYQFGRSVSFRLLETLFGTLLHSNPEQPLHTPKPIKSVDDINSQLTDVHFDMDLLMNEVQYHINSFLERVSGAEVVRSVSMQKVREITSVVDRLNLLSSNTTFIDVQSFDPTDPKFVDRAATTASLNSDAGIVTLRRSRTGTKRHKIIGVTGTHDIRIVEDIVTLRKAVIPGSKIVNIFNDTLSSWQYEILTQNNNDLTIDFDFLIDDGVGLPVNRIIGRFPTSGTVRIFVSIDGQNWFSFGSPQRSNGIELVWISKTALVNFIRIQIIKDGPDSSVSFKNSPVNSYVYGIESIALFDTGFEQKSIYQTVALTAANGLPIRQASIDVDTEPLANTQIDFELADANQSPLVFRPIKPSNQEDSTLSDRKVSSVIDFSKSFTENRDFRISPDGIVPDLAVLETGQNVFIFTDGKSRANETSTNAKHAGYKALNHAVRTWRIDAVDLRLNASDDVRNVNLQLGIDGWLKTRRDLQSTESVNNVYAELTDTEGMSLFRTITETIDIGAAVTQQIPMTRAVLTGTNTRLSPSFGSGTRDIFSSVLEIVELGNADIISGVEVENTTFQGAAANQVLVIPASSSDVFVAGNTRARVEGVGYFEVTIDTNDDKRAVINKQISGSGTLVPGLSYKVTVGARNITHLIDSILGNKIVVKTVAQISGKIEVTYNSPLTSKEVVSATTIKIVSATDPNVVFHAGRDFSFQNNRIFISKSTRIPKSVANNFTPGPDSYPIRLSFSIAISTPGLDEYITWVKVTAQDSVEFEYTDFTIDEIIGERASIDSIDLTTEKKLLLSPGWHRISVLSKAYTLDQPNSSAAISKVITLRSVDGTPLMATGRVFSKQKALFDPLQKVGLFELSRSRSQNDMTVFGMDEDNNIYLNFHPGEDARIFVLPVLAADGFSNTGTRTSAETAEIGRLPFLRYRINYERLSLAQDPVTEVVIRAILKRRATSTGDVTPVLRRIKLKAV